MLMTSTPFLRFWQRFGGCSRYLYKPLFALCALVVLSIYPHRLRFGLDSTMTSVLKGLVVLAGLLTVEVWAFRPKATTSTSRAQAKSLQAVTQLVFRVDYERKSDALPKGTTSQELSNFLANESNREIFLSAGNSRPFQYLEMTPQFKQYWRDACNHFSSTCLPDDDDKLIAVDAEVKFPGMKLVITSLQGVKELPPLKKNTDRGGRGGGGTKAYEVLLVGEKLQPRGAPPVVWLYNKMTGNDKRAKNEFYPPQQTRIRSVITGTELDDGELALSFRLNLRITVEFPRLLLKLIPTSKEKAEEQGSKSVLQAVSKDVDRAMQAAFDAFISG